MTHDYVSVRRQGRVAIVTFDRGNPLNALSLQAIEELTNVARDLESDLEICAVVVTTPAGSGFSAGRDLADPAMDLRRKMPMLERRRVAGAGKRLCAAWESIEAITIAAIERFAIGGGLALALAFDLRVMGQGAHIRAPEVSLGLSMSWGSIPRLVNLVGPARTKQILCPRARTDRRRRSPRLGSGAGRRPRRRGRGSCPYAGGPRGGHAAGASAHDQGHRQRGCRRQLRRRGSHGHRRGHADGVDPRTSRRQWPHSGSGGRLFFGAPEGPSRHG